MRYTVGDVAKLAGCSSYLVRRLNNLGYLKCGRDTEIGEFSQIPTELRKLSGNCWARIRLLMTHKKNDL